MLKRIAALLLAALACLTLAACAGPGTPDEPVTTTTTPVETTPADTTPAATEIVIAENKTSGYTVIRPDECSDTLMNASIDLRTRMSEALECSIGIGVDWHKPTEPVPESAKEIVVGACDRPETERLMHGLREKDFIIAYANERVYIVGGCDESTARGIEYFLKYYVDEVAHRSAVMNDLCYLDSYAYPLGSVSICGVSLIDYTIVYPQGDVLAEAAARNLSDYLVCYGGMQLSMGPDTTAETEYEILVGATNRPESSMAAAVKPGEGQYVLAQTGSRIVMYGETYMVGGAVSDFINNYAVSGTGVAAPDITTLPTVMEARSFEFEQPDSAILLIGDGMGYNHVEATLASGKLDTFVARTLPNQGSAKTYSFSVQIGDKGYTDSAAAGTALATGYKTINSYLGMNYKSKSVQNVRELAHSVGARTAILTTDVITGATPAAFLVHVNSRNSTDEIQAQIDRLLKNNEVDYAISNKDSDDIMQDIPGALWGIAQGEHGYFSMIEEAYNDKRSHKNDLSGTTDRVVRYNSIIAYCIEFTMCHPRSVLIVTADHETGGITLLKNGKYAYTSDNHTNVDVPVYALGYGTEYFNDTTVENIDIAKFMARIYGAQAFGQ